MLSSVVNLLRERGGALSVQEISLALDIESGALHPMLDMLERKGKIKRIELPCSTGCAGGCTQADSMIFYKAAS
jgi:hypothetical protein